MVAFFLKVSNSYDGNYKGLGIKVEGMNRMNRGTNELRTIFFDGRLKMTRKQEKDNSFVFIEVLNSFIWDDCMTTGFQGGVLLQELQHGKDLDLSIRTPGLCISQLYLTFLKEKFDSKHLRL